MVSGGLRSGSCEAERASEGELAVLTTTNQCDCRKTGQGYNVSAIVRFSAKDSILQTISQADAKGPVLVCAAIWDAHMGKYVALKGRSVERYL